MCFLWHCACRRDHLPPGQDPHDNTINTTFTLDDLMEMAEHLMQKGGFLSERDLSMLLCQCVTCGRGDDVRARHLNELMKPLFRRSIGMYFCMQCLALNSALETNSVIFKFGQMHNEFVGIFDLSVNLMELNFIRML